MEQELIYEMIGTEPDKQNLRVPWLGDWKRRRMAGWYTPVLPNNIKKLAIACRDQLESVQAVRSTAPYPDLHESQEVLSRFGNFLTW